MSDNYLASMDQPTECICPKCGKIHTVVMFWTGKGMPRKFCKTHDPLSEKWDEPPEISYGRRITPVGMEL